MTIAVLSVFALAFIAPWLHRFARGWTGWLVALLPLSLTLYFASYIQAIANGGGIVTTLDWATGLGVRLTFHLDGLSLVFALLICGIGALISVYAGGYLAGHEQLGRFYLYLLLFMGAMLGLVLAGNLFALFVFWELTSISSYLLIGFEHEDGEARGAALQALIITSGGGLALLAGLILLAQVGGSYEMLALFGRGDEVRASSLYLPILLLILIGAFTKSAQFPFHFWLPGAMQAPTPVSAYLHSATMVKAGVYLLARLSIVLGGTFEWTAIVTTTGAATMIVGGVLALFETNLKRMLAYSTVSALGTLVLLLGLGTDTAIKGAMVFLFAHALYKGALFMVAGAVDHETGTKDVERLGGLRRLMPITTSAAVLAAISLAGFGPVFSFIGKELLLEAVLHAEGFRVALIALTVFAGALFVAVACVVAIRPFFGTLKETPKHPHEPSFALWLAPALLAIFGLGIGLLPGTVASRIIQPSVVAVMGRSETVDLSLWHGFNVALALSVISVVIGLLIYRSWDRLRRATPWTEKVFAYGPARMYASLLNALYRASALQTRLLQSGYLRFYLLTIIITTAVLVAYTLFARSGFAVNLSFTDVRFYEASIAALTLLAGLAAVRSRSRLAAVASLGIVGYCVALVFILFGAPDLALTQFLIETLTVILLVLVLYHLPRFAIITRTPARVRDMLIAGCCGGMITMLVLFTASIQFDPQVSNFYAAQSLPAAHGRNIVNVILVDFRGLDTLGEITVLAVAGVGVYALLKLRPQRRLHDEEGGD